jgi:hypothetical protein
MKIPPSHPSAVDHRTAELRALKALNERFPHLVQQQIATPVQRAQELIYGDQRRAEQQAGLPFTTEVINGLRHYLQGFTYRKDLDIPNIGVEADSTQVTLVNYNYPKSPKGPANQNLSQTAPVGICSELAFEAGRQLAYKGPEGMSVAVVTGNDNGYYHRDGSNHVMIVACRTQDVEEVHAQLLDGDRQRQGLFPDKAVIIDPSAGTAGYPPSAKVSDSVPQMMGYRFKAPEYKLDLAPPVSLQVDRLELPFNQYHETTNLPLGMVADVLPETPNAKNPKGLAEFRLQRNPETGQVKPILQVRRYHQADPNNIIYDPPIDVSTLKDSNPVKQFLKMLSDKLS